MSVATGGAEGNSDSYSWVGSLSTDGRFVAFTSFATNLVAGDTNGFRDAFVRDRQSGTTERVSVDTGGIEGNDISLVPSISADGRFVAFTSFASNLVAGDTNGTFDIFVRDRQSGTTERVSIATGGVEADGRSDVPRISADGRFVAFTSRATNLVAGDTNGSPDSFVRDLQNGTTERVSVATGGAEGNSDSDRPSISADGRFVAFYSSASNLVAGDTNGTLDVFVRDRQSGTTERVSVATGGAEGNSGSYDVSISADGRFVAFQSYAGNLVAGDTNGSADNFVRDLQNGTTERVSVATGGTEGNSISLEPSISADGRLVAFWSRATNLVAGDTNGTTDIFMRDRQSGTTERVSVDTGGAEGNSDCDYPSISADGRFVAFTSFATNLVATDTNGFEDAFVHELCQPASASFRNAGSNPASYTCNAPVLGGNCVATVDLSTTGHSSAYLFAFGAPSSFTLSQGQVLLGSGAISRQGPVAGPQATFSFTVPNDLSLCGVQLTTQALHLGTAIPFALSNAMDLVVGQ